MKLDPKAAGALQKALDLLNEAISMQPEGAAQDRLAYLTDELEKLAHAFLLAESGTARKERP